MLNIHFWRNAPINANNMPKALKTGLLSQASAGQQVTITGLGGLSAAQRQHLQAYGLLPGRSVRVLAQRPVTIVLVEQTELAFETEIAQQIMIE
jgi:Fe2+ transport system protein FeoA